MTRPAPHEARQDMARRFLDADAHIRTCGTCAAGGSCGTADTMTAAIDVRAVRYRDDTERWEITR